MKKKIKKLTKAKRKISIGDKCLSIIKRAKRELLRDGGNPDDYKVWENDAGSRKWKRII